MEKNDIVLILSDMGILLPEIEDVNLKDYIADSLQFISFIAEIENRFNIEIPDSMLTVDVLSSLNGLVSLLDELIVSNTSVQ